MILGIESTAHTFGIGVVSDGKILANVRDMYTTESGGIIPTESAKHHREVAEKIYSEAIAASEIKEKEIDAIAFSQGPGLAPCLLEGMKFAKELSERLKIPIVPVNHCVAHLEIGKITGAKDPVLLYCSGANTQVIAYASGKYRIFGETLDIGVGNFIDNVARYFGLGFPGGPAMQKLAEKGKNYVELPYRVKGMDVAFSGIQTKMKQLIEKMDLENSSEKLHSQNAREFSLTSNRHPARFSVGKIDNVKNFKNLSSADLDNNNFTSMNHINNSEKYSKEDLAFSLQETVFAMLVEVAERALAHTGKNELLLGGGVACNSRLQEMCRIMCEERGCKFFVPSRDLLVDNAAMIAYLGEIMFNAGIKSTARCTPGRCKTPNCGIKGQKEIDKIDILPRERTDDINVIWR